MSTTISFIRQYHRGEDLFDYLVIGDKSWVNFSMLETKKALKMWKTDKLTRKKFKAIHSVGSHTDLLLGLRGSASHGIFANEKGKGTEEES